MKQVELSAFIHRGQNCIKIQFPFDTELQGIVKNIKGRTWSATQGCWYLPHQKNSINEIQAHFRNKAHIKYRDFEKEPFVNPVTIIKNPPDNPIPMVFMMGEISQHNRSLLEKLKKWMLDRRYSIATIDPYMDGLELFSRWNLNTPFEKVKAEDVMRFNNDYIFKKGLFAGHQNDFIRAMELLIKVCGIEISLKLNNDRK